MSTTNNEYKKMAEKASPPSPKIKNCIKAFLFGGGICTFGQLLNWGFEKLGFSEDVVKSVTISPTVQSDLVEQSIQDFMNYCNYKVQDFSEFIKHSKVPVRF